MSTGAGVPRRNGHQGSVSASVVLAVPRPHARPVRGELLDLRVEHAGVGRAAVSAEVDVIAPLVGQDQEVAARQLQQLVVVGGGAHRLHRAQQRAVETPDLVAGRVAPKRARGSLRVGQPVAGEELRVDGAVARREPVDRHARPVVERHVAVGARGEPEQRPFLTGLAGALVRPGREVHGQAAHVERADLGTNDRRHREALPGFERHVRREPPAPGRRTVDRHVGAGGGGDVDGHGVAAIARHVVAHLRVEPWVERGLSRDRQHGGLDAVGRERPVLAAMGHLRRLDAQPEVMGGRGRQPRDGLRHRCGTRSVIDMVRRAVSVP
jgi:hypothetical protein